MAQYKHDRFFKFYIQSLYKYKGDTRQNIQVRNDEDLEIDLMFIGKTENEGWQEEKLGLFDLLMQIHHTIIVEHYSGYLEETDILKSITRKNLYWEPKKKEQIEIAKTQQKLTNSQRLSKEASAQIESHNPFTWILTVNCSPKMLELCGAKPAPEFGLGVYRLIPILRMGIVVIDQLEYSPETMWLKMLGDRVAANRAFGDIRQLLPEQREKNDIIIACTKYCVYLQELPTENLEEEDRDYMKTMAQIDAWYEAELNKAKLQGKQESEFIMELFDKVRSEIRGELKGEIIGELKGKIESANKTVQARFGVDALTPQLISQIERLNKKQLDEFIVGMLGWQQLSEMEEWLSEKN